MAIFRFIEIKIDHDNNLVPYNLPKQQHQQQGRYIKVIRRGNYRVLFALESPTIFKTISRMFGTTQNMKC